MSNFSHWTEDELTTFCGKDARKLRMGWEGGVWPGDMVFSAPHWERGVFEPLSTLESVMDWVKRDGAYPEFCPTCQEMAQRRERVKWLSGHL